MTFDHFILCAKITFGWAQSLITPAAQNSYESIVMYIASGFAKFYFDNSCEDVQSFSDALIAYNGTWFRDLVESAFVQMGGASGTNDWDNNYRTGELDQIASLFSALASGLGSSGSVSVNLTTEVHDSSQDVQSYWYVE